MNGCPQCGSDDYACLEEDKDGLPDYNGPKECQECFEVFV